MIFQSASEMVNNGTIRQKILEIQEQAKSDREWWEKRRATIQSDFMKELGEETGSGSVPGSSSGPTSGGAKSSSAPAENAGSDEDTVLVEGGGPAISGSAKGTTKKRKGKK